MLNEVDAAATPGSHAMLAGAGDAWSQPWFASTLVGGLANEGLEPNACAWLESIIGVAPPPLGLDDLIERVSGAADSTERRLSLEALGRLRRISAFNDRCYRRLTAEDERVTAWPNNQRTRVADPDFYFNI